jgi:hypothetical protein
VIVAQSVILGLSGVCDASWRFDGLLPGAGARSQTIPLGLVLEGRPDVHLCLSRNVDAELQRDPFQFSSKWDDRSTIALDM